MTRSFVAGMVAVIIVITGVGPANAQDIEDFLWSVKAGDVVAVTVYLKKYPKLLHLKNGANKTLLHWAAEYGHVAMVRLLLKHGLKVTALNKWG